jgi:hypothetical protein
MELDKVYNPKEYEQKAIALVQREKQAWEYANVWVSDDAYYTMRDEIDAARKNYFGQFESSADSKTDMEKLWVPLTEWTVERTVANIDLDTKDIHLKHPEGKDVRVPIVMRMIVDNFLKKIGFGEFLNDLLRRLAIDGTAIAKCYIKYNEEYKRNLPELRIVDPLNFIGDPTMRNIQSSPSIEKSPMTKPEADKYRKKWKNLEFIKWSEGSVPKATFYERWGKIPLIMIKEWGGSQLSEEDKDEWKDKWVEGVIVASSPLQKSRGSGELRGEIQVVHHIARNTKNIKPYEECWLRRVPGRWHGRGIPEQLAGLQEYINTIVNIRRDELLNKLAGKYKIRKGSGITKQMLESIRAGGAIPVDNMDDIQELRESDVKPSAYREPLDVIGMAERVSGAREVPTDPRMEPTTAVIQERGVRSLSNLTQENIGLFLERLFRRHLIPQIVECLKDGEIVRITGEPDDLDIIDEAYVNSIVNSIVNGAGSISFAQRQNIRARIERQKKQWGNSRPQEVKKAVFDTEYDTEVYVTAERIDPALILRNLNDFLSVYAPLPQADMGVINEVVKTFLGTLEVPQVRHMEMRVPVQAPAEQGPRPRREAPTPQVEFERANLEGVISPREK